MTSGRKIQIPPITYSPPLKSPNQNWSGTTAGNKQREIGKWQNQVHKSGWRHSGLVSMTIVASEVCKFPRVKLMPFTSKKPRVHNGLA